MKDALSSIRGRTRQKIFFLFFTSLLLISFIAFQTSSTIFSPVGGENNSFPIKNNSPPSGDINNILPKIASEEESIDSWDVHPESGRWENILDDSIEDRIVDSQFEILAVQNETSGSSGYEMNRGTTKTDGKFEWRSKADGSGNQTEFFRDVIGDEADFTEGDNEGFGSVGASTVSVSNGLLLDNVTADNAGFRYVFPSLISGVINYTFEFQLKSSRDGGQLRISLNKDGFVAIATLIITPSTNWETISISPLDWTGGDYFSSNTLHSFQFQYISGTVYPIILSLDFLNLIGSYDFATHIEGEIEDTWDWEEDNDTEGWTGLVNQNVSEGFLRGTMAAVSQDFLETAGGLIVRTDIFKTFKIKINSSSSIRGDLFGRDSANNLDFLALFKIGITTELTEYEVDLTQISSWVDDTFFQQIILRFTDDSGDLEGDEIVFIDHVLLLGEFNPSDSVIGLMDSDKNPLLNISTHFFGNDSARFEFEILDSTGELSYHFYSDLFDDLNQFITGKVKFDVLRSRLEVTLTAENNSRIDKITFPNEFIIDSGLTPALFANVISPDIFVSTFTIDHSWQSLFIDWIKADFKRSEWVQTDAPTDSDWLEDRWDIAKVQDDISDDSAWDLYVPYLDTVSASLTMQFDNQTLGIDNNDLAGVGFQLIGVDFDDGEEHPIYQLSVVQFRADDGGLKWFTEGAILENGSITVKDFERNAFPLNENPRLSFSMSLSEERNIASCKVRFWHNRSDLNDFFDLVAEINITTAPFTDLSQEFILRTSFTADLLANNVFVGMVEDFGFTDLDIFQDIANAVIEPIGNFLQTLFTAAFKFLADIFRAVGDIIGLAISVMQEVLEGAINAVAAAVLTMQGVLQIAIDAVTTAIDTLKTAFDTALGLVQTALGDVITELQGLAAAIATAVWDGIGSALDFITDAVGDIWTILIATIADIFDEIVTVVLSLFSDITDILVGIIFFAWDAIGLPDILALGNDLIVLFGQLIEFLISTLADVIQLGVDLAWVILVVWWIWAIPVQWARANFEPISGIGNFIEVFFYDIFPWNILGFHAYIPQGVVFTLWLILLLPADFALFTAMGL